MVTTKPTSQHKGTTVAWFSPEFLDAFARQHGVMEEGFGIKWPLNVVHVEVDPPCVVVEAREIKPNEKYKHAPCNRKQIIKKLRQEIKYKETMLKHLLDAEETEEARLFIEKSGITLDKIELSEGDGKPWFNEIKYFVSWLRANSNKPYAEWNHRLYYVADLLNGEMPKKIPFEVFDILRKEAPCK
jgi:hypothetical protein